MGKTNSLQCEMVNDCEREVTMIDNKGYIYCEPHGMQRRSWRPCRKLRPYEINRLERGAQIKAY